jgi:glycosyltransferase involved in cell wall biosynthesis
MGQRIILTTPQFSMDDIAWGLSAMDVVLANGAGVGWGLVASQSLACGVPVIHGNYAGGTDFVPTEFLVDYTGYRLESKWMIRRPDFAAKDWADRVEFALTPEGKALAKLPEYLDWNNCWPEWQKWLRDGVETP